MAKLTLTDITAGFSLDDYNANNTLIEAAVENTLSRDGTTPNTMSAALDMNSNDINNIGITRTTELYLNGVKVSGVYPEDLQLLGSLLDVTYGTLADQDGLMYNSSTAVWENRPIVEADISDLQTYALETLPNSVYLKGRNLADSASYDLIGVNASDWVEFGDTSRNIQYDGALHKFSSVLELYADIDSKTGNLGLDAGDITLLAGRVTITPDGTGIAIDANGDVDISGTLDVTGAAIFSSTVTTAGTYTSHPTVPLTLLIESGAGLDQKNWAAAAFGESYYNLIYDDAFANGYTYLQLQRSGTGAGIQVDTIDLTAVTDVTINSTLVVTGQTISVGANAGGDSVLDFYDDTNNTFRSIFWDDSESAFFFEDNTGAFQQFGTGSGGGPDMLLGGM